ncbi:hypothetical protein SAMN05446037_100311 [Anaerovirgula multivorans]|uniref:Uncharacterized protein n=1 Tax=Anaerovirgula multivorans TaxID=312168 RepID=A0A239B567_9FIRM|nr:hypothetical protein [Anaerovirgula multivorans]SNS03010.1 hypothetical protein SAMN05446037_100311 [Anaerovirgula multivorans]
MVSEGFDLITGDFLMTFTGAVLATNIITHFIKDYTPDYLDKKIITLLVVVSIMFTSELVFGSITMKSVYLDFLNSFMVAAAAMGNYEILTSKTKIRMMKELEKEISQKTEDEIKKNFEM